MKKIIFIAIVLVMLLFASTIVVAKKPADLPDQAYQNERKEDINEFLFMLFDEIAFRLYEKLDRVPQGILERLSSLGGR